MVIFLYKFNKKRIIFRVQGKGVYFQNCARKFARSTDFTRNAKHQFLGGLTKKCVVSFLVIFVALDCVTASFIVVATIDVLNKGHISHIKSYL